MANKIPDKNIDKKPKNEGIDLPFNEDTESPQFDIEMTKQKASDERKKSRLKSAFRLLIVFICVIVVITIAQTIINTITGNSIKVLDDVNIFFQYALTTVLGYLFATKMDD